MPSDSPPWEGKAGEGEKIMGLPLQIQQKGRNPPLKLTSLKCVPKQCEMSARDGWTWHGNAPAGGGS